MEAGPQPEHPASPAASPLLCDHDALTMLLQHSSITQHPRTVCALMCTSKQMRQSVLQLLRGLLDLEFSARTWEGVQQCAQFLECSAGLARTLELEWNHVNLKEVETLLAAALQQAATPHNTPPTETGTPTHAEPSTGAAVAGVGGGECWAGPLQLRCMKANVAGPLLLQQLPTCTLTNLELGHVVDYLGEWSASHLLPARCAEHVCAIRHSPKAWSVAPGHTERMCVWWPALQLQWCACIVIMLSLGCVILVKGNSL